MIKQTKTVWWKILLTWLAIFLVIYVLIRATTTDFTAVDDATIQKSPLREGAFRQNCPHTIQGNPNATLVIKYFDNPYCPWCRKEEPILMKLEKEIGNLYRMERYDIRYCTKQVNQYKIAGTPTFIFIGKGEGTNGSDMQLRRDGYQEESDVTDIICTMSKGC